MLTSEQQFEQPSLAAGSADAPSSEPSARFCWMRETAPGHLEHDGGLRIAKSEILTALLGIHPAQQRTTAEPAVSLDTAFAALSGAVRMDVVPTWARRRLAIILGPLASEEQRATGVQNAAALVDLAARLAEAIGQSRDIEVHLPFIDRRNWSHRFEILAQTRFVRWAGRIVPEALLVPGRMEEYNARWLAVSAVAPETNTEITFLHTHTVSSNMLRTFLPVPNDAKARPAPAAGPVSVEIRQTLSSTACRAWNAAPDETSASYFTVNSQTSIAIQDAVRRWLAWYWLSSADRFDNIQDTQTVLSYLVSRPFPGRRRTDFTYDVMSTEWAYVLFQFARRPLETRLRPIYSALKAAGRTDLSLKYYPEQAKFILQRLRKQFKTIRAIISTEGQIVNHILKFGLELRGATDAHTVNRLAQDYAEGLASRLRHVFHEEDLSWLSSALLMEATNALWVAMGGDPALRTTVTIRPAVASPVPVNPAALARVPDPSLPAPSQC